MVIKCILAAVIGYLFGNIPSGVLIARIYGIGDIRKHGSGNTGTTNVLRTLGWLPSVLTLVGDCLKGYVACLIGKALCGDPGMLLAGLGAILGHDFPVFMGFKGGKGIATSLGLIIAINPWLAPPSPSPSSRPYCSGVGHTTACFWARPASRRRCRCSATEATSSA